MLDLAPHEQQLAKQSVRMGQPLPDRIANAPELENGLALFLFAFFDLDSERTHGLGFQSIPWGAIKDYALTFEFDPEQTDDLFFFIKKMDSEHIKRLKVKTGVKK